MEEFKITNLQDVKTIFDEVHKLSYDIPFSNSKYQNENYVIKRSIGKGRQFRDGLLRLNDRLEALRECYYSLKKSDLDVKEKELNISKLQRQQQVEKDDIEYELIQIKIDRLNIEKEQILSSKPSINKLVNDNITEIKDLYSVIKTFPIYSREEFEQLEKEHFDYIHKKELFGITESVESLLKIGCTLSSEQANLDKLQLINKIKGDGLLWKEF